MTTSEERRLENEQLIEQRNERANKVMKMWKDGMTKRAISEQLGIPESTVMNIIRDENRYNV